MAKKLKMFMQKKQKMTLQRGSMENVYEEKEKMTLQMRMATQISLISEGS